MANFMCQPDWTVGCPGMQPTTKQINTHTHYAIICIWLAHTITETLTYINICTHTSLSSVSLQNPNIVCMLFWYINSANVFKSIIESITEAGKNTWVGCLSLLQRIFLIQGSNPGLPHCRPILYPLSHQGSMYSHIPNRQLWWTGNRAQTPTKPSLCLSAYSAAPSASSGGWSLLLIFW